MASIGPQVRLCGEQGRKAIIHRSRHSLRLYFLVLASPHIAAVFGFSSVESVFLTPTDVTPFLTSGTEPMLKAQLRQGHSNVSHFMQNKPADLYQRSWHDDVVAEQSESSDRRQKRLVTV